MGSRNQKGFECVVRCIKLWVVSPLDPPLPFPLPLCVQVLRAREVPQPEAEQAFASDSNRCIARNGRGRGDRGEKSGKDGKSEWLSRRVPKELLETRCRDSQAKMTSMLQQVSLDIGIQVMGWMVLERDRS